MKANQLHGFNAVSKARLINGARMLKLEVVRFFAS